MLPVCRLPDSAAPRLPNQALASLTVGRRLPPSIRPAARFARNRTRRGDVQPPGPFWHSERPDCADGRTRVGALVTRVGLRRHPTRRLVGQLVFFAALTALAALSRHRALCGRPDARIDPAADLHRAGQDHLVDQCRLVADQRRARLSHFRGTATGRAPRPGSRGRGHLCRGAAVGRRLCLRCPGGDADRDVGNRCDHSWAWRCRAR